MIFGTTKTHSHVAFAGSGLARMWRRGVLFFCCALIWAAVAEGQSTFGSFTGTVKDPSGSVVASVKVTATNVGTGAMRSVVTDATGSYVIVNLEPAQYAITMEAPGFEVSRYPDIVLETRQTLRIDGSLAVANQTQTVMVTAEAVAPINTDVSNIAETKVGRELNDLPEAVSSRASGSTSAITTLTTQPGVEVDNNGNISVAGARPAQMSIRVSVW